MVTLYAIFTLIITNLFQEYEMAVFLTKPWFEEVEKLTQNAGDLNLPPAVKNLTMNLKVSDTPEGEVLVSFYDGNIHKGLKDDAKTTLSLDADTLRSVIFERDMNKAMEAFMAGKIKVEGDMGQLMAIQTTSTSPEQKQLFKDILSISEKS